MLDGRVLGAFQVEYKPFGKRPLKREAPGGRELHAELHANGTCLFPVPNSTRATPKKWDMPVSSSELHAGSNQKMVGACFQSRGTSKAQVPLVLSSITFLPGIGGFDT